MTSTWSIQDIDTTVTRVPRFSVFGRMGGRPAVSAAPIADWSDRDVFDYLRDNGLPYHPLWSQGYVSIGDVHTTRALHEVGSEEHTRFFGLKRECGLHDVL